MAYHFWSLRDWVPPAWAEAILPRQREESVRMDGKITNQSIRTNRLQELDFLLTNPAMMLHLTLSVCMVTFLSESQQ